MTQPDILTDRSSLRGVDTNSLLRLFDDARRVRFSGDTGVTRQRAARAVDRVSNELRRRGENVRL